MNELTPIQKEIVMALEQMKEKSLITEAVLAKKIREKNGCRDDSHLGNRIPKGIVGG